MVSYSFSVAFSSARGVYKVSYSVYGVLVSQWRSVVPMVFMVSYSVYIWCPSVSQWCSILPVLSIVSYTVSQWCSVVPVVSSMVSYNIVLFNSAYGAQ